MVYDILVMSTPECRYLDVISQEMEQKKIDHIFKIKNLENIGTIDIKQLFEEFYNGIDGIIILIKGKRIGISYDSKYASFQKYVDEANRILEKRGYSDQRVNICCWDDSNRNETLKSFINIIEKIKMNGPNPIKKEWLN
jgi:coenzyme F420-reducing hydrogenase delta subunit